MTFKQSDPVTGKSRGTKEQALEYARKNNGKRLPEVEVYISELWRACQMTDMDFGLLFAQACDETGVFTSRLWETTLNPAGIGALETLENPGDIHYVGGSFTAAAGAWAQVVHMWAYVHGEIPSNHPLHEYKKYDPRYSAVFQAGYAGKTKKLSDLDGKWAANPNYSKQIVNHAIRAFGNISYMPLPESEKQENNKMGMKKYRFVGLARDVWLPDDIVVEIAIVPSSVRNVRSNSKFSGQTSYTQHETANFNRGAGADMHKRWLHGGASGSSVGFNFVVDDKKIIQLTPLDEVTWAAGTANGNKFSYHSELCVNNDINHTKARRNAAALAGGVLAAKGWNTSKLVQHNVWWGKDCPYLLRRNGLWPQFVNQVAAFITQAKNGVSGSVPSTAAFKKGDTLKVIDNLNVRQGYSTKDRIVKTLPVDTRVQVISDNSGNFVKSNDGYTWYNIKGDFGTGWAAGDWMIKIDPPKAEVPESGWPYPDPIVPGFWEELMKEGATHVFDADMLWVRSNDLYEVKQGGTKRLRLSIASSESVGPDLPEKTRIRLAAAGQSAMDKKAYGITEGLTRVLLDDLKFVDDEDNHGNK